MNIVVLVGLPCSGKTYYGVELAKNLGYVFWDNMESRGWGELDQAKNMGVPGIVFSDLQLLEPVRQTQLNAFLGERGIISEWLYFEKAPLKCEILAAYMRRVGELQGDLDSVKRQIREYSKVYVIPPQSKVVKIWQPNVEVKK